LVQVGLLHQAQFRLAVQIVFLVRLLLRVVAEVVSEILEMHLLLVVVAAVVAVTEHRKQAQQEQVGKELLAVQVKAITQLSALRVAVAVQQVLVLTQLLV
jgi:hypothetical protein